MILTRFVQVACTGVAVAGWLAMSGAECGKALATDVDVWPLERRGEIAFRVVIQGTFDSVESSCECLEVGSVEGTIIRGRIRCDRKQAYVEPGVVVLKQGRTHFVPVPCPIK